MDHSPPAGWLTAAGARSQTVRLAVAQAQHVEQFGGVFGIAGMPEHHGTDPIGDRHDAPPLSAMWHSHAGSSHSDGCPQRCAYTPTGS